MTLKEAIKVLERHNKWRKGAKIEMQTPSLISEAMDIAINILKGLKPIIMKPRKNKIPAFIPNQPGSGYFGLDQGKRNQEEERKQRENQRKLMLNNKNHKY